MAVLFGSIFDKIFIDFTSAYEVALSFVLCDGEPHRHNRTVLFNEEYHFGAVASHYDESIGLMHAVGMTDDILDLNEPKFDVLFKNKMKQVAIEKGATFIDLYSLSLKMYEASVVKYTN